MSKFKDFLSNYDDDFASAEASGFEDLPDGTYQTRLYSIYLEDNAKTGNVALKAEFEVLNEAFKGRRIFYYKAINQKSIPYLKSDLKRLCIEPENFHELESYFPGALDKIVEVQLKHSKPDNNGKTYQNTYINKVLGEAPRQARNPVEELPF